MSLPRIGCTANSRKALRKIVPAQSARGTTPVLDADAAAGATGVAIVPFSPTVPFLGRAGSSKSGMASASLDGGITGTTQFGESPGPESGNGQGGYAPQYHGRHGAKPRRGY